MRVSTQILISVLLSVSVACSDTMQGETKVQTTTIQENLIDTLNHVQIRNNWVKPRESLELNNIPERNSDTLTIVTCSDYVYEPFRNVQGPSDLSNGLLKSFQVKIITDTIHADGTKFHLLTLGENKLILYLENLTEGTRHSYIQNGKVLDRKVTLMNNIKVGMTQIEFMNVFFENFPDKLLKQYNYVELESCVSDLNHIYSFQDNLLKSIDFIPIGSTWKINYE